MMASPLVEDDICRIGSTTPRVYTPPLKKNCLGPVVYEDGESVECYCGCGLNPDTSWGFDCIEFLEMVCGWALMPWQKWLYVHALEKGNDGAGFRYKVLLILVARQNGKSRWLKGIGLWRLFLSRYGRADKECPGARLAVIAAQNLDYAENMLKEVVDEIRDNELLCRELINHRVTNGKHRAILTNRRYWRAATASRKGARSLSVDIAMLDELREHTTWDAWNAIVPTTTVRRYSQVVCTSNAGDLRSEVLRAQRDGAWRRATTGETEHTTTGFFEWSVPMEEDPRDPRFWYMANPSMGLLNDFTLEDLKGFLEAMEYRNMPGFQTEHLCQWVDAMQPGIMPAEHWAETHDSGSARAPDSKVYAALDVNYERSRSYVAIAARRTDGYLHIEVINAARGTDWIIPWLSDPERKKRFEGVCIQKSSAPVSGMIEDLKAAGVKVVEWGPGTEISAGCHLLYDQITEHRIFHRPAPVLDRAAASGVARHVGDGWVFDRRNSPVDVSPLVACAAAVWLEHHRGTPPPEIHDWPTDDIIQQWEEEARGPLWQTTT
jgi:hypothetical protein